MHSSIKLNLIKVSTGNFLNAAAAMAANLIVARQIGVADYGVYGTLIVVFTMLTILIDAGTSTALVTTIKQNAEYQSSKVFSTVLLFRSAIGILVILAILPTSALISRLIFHTQDSSHYFIWIALGATFMAIGQTYQSYAQARGEFTTYLTLAIVPSLSKLVAIVLVSIFVGHAGGLPWFVAVTAIGGIPLCIAGLLFQPAKAPFSIEFDLSLLSKIYRVSRWIGASNIVSGLTFRLDIVFLNILANTHETGYYNAAFQAACIIPLITSSLTNTLLPTVAGFRSKQDIQGFIHKLMKVVPLLIILALVLELAAPTLIDLAFGDKYAHSLLPLQILIPVFLAGLVSNQLQLLAFPLNKPHLHLYSVILQSTIMLSVDWMLIPRLGAAGAAIGMLAAKITAIIITWWIIARYVHSHNETLLERKEAI